LAAYEHDDFKQVKMASGEKQAVGPSVDNCIVDLGVCTTRLKVYVTALGAYDLIIVIQVDMLYINYGGHPPFHNLKMFFDWLKTVFWQFWQFTIFSRF
jgi:hypothetical protein